MTFDFARRAVAVLFDFNGVLVDDEPLHFHAFQRVLGTVGLQMSQARYRRYLGLDDRATFAAFLRDTDSDAARDSDAAIDTDGKCGGDTRARIGLRLMTDIDVLVDRKQAAYSELLEQREGRAPLFPAARDLVRSLHLAGVPMAVVSGARRIEIDIALEEGRLADCFSAIVAAEDVRACKPEPAGYCLAVQRLRAGRPGLLVGVAIEDAPAGIAAARAAGLRSIGVTTSCTRAELGDADRVVDSLAEIDPAAPIPGVLTIPELAEFRSVSRTSAEIM